MENHGCYTASQIEDLVRKAGPLAQARALILADMSEEIQDMHMDDHRCQIALNATPKKKERCLLFLVASFALSKGKNCRQKRRVK